MTTHAKIENVKDKAMEKGQELQDKLDYFLERVSESKDQIVAKAKHHPGMALAVATGIGFLIGLITRKK